MPARSVAGFSKESPCLRLSPSDTVKTDGRCSLGPKLRDIHKQSYFGAFPSSIISVLYLHGEFGAILCARGSLVRPHGHSHYSDTWIGSDGILSHRTCLLLLLPYNYTWKMHHPSQKYGECITTETFLLFLSTRSCGGVLNCWEYDFRFSFVSQRSGAQGGASII